MSYKERFAERMNLFDNTCRALYRSFKQYDEKLDPLDLIVNLNPCSEQLNLIESYWGEAGRISGVIPDSLAIEVNDKLRSLYTMFEDLTEKDPEENENKPDEETMKRLQELKHKVGRAKREISLENRLRQPMYKGLDGQDVLLLQSARFLEMNPLSVENMQRYREIRKYFLLPDAVGDYSKAGLGEASYTQADVLEAVNELGNFGADAARDFEDFDVVNGVFGKTNDASKPSIPVRKRMAFEEITEMSSAHIILARIGGDPEEYIRLKLGMSPRYTPLKVETSPEN